MFFVHFILQGLKVLYFMYNIHVISAERPANLEDHLTSWAALACPLMHECLHIGLKIAQNVQRMVALEITRNGR